jgi:phosphomannomutase
MINVSPIGRACTRDERNEFERYDHEHKIRATFVDILRKEFADYGLRFSVGGQISFDVFPLGWDKSFALRFVEKEYEEIHFWGDKCYEGGNDFEIWKDERTIGHTVKDPSETIT